MKFSDLKFVPHNISNGGIKSTHFFDNGYGISVVRFPGSYGYKDNLYECAVVKGTPKAWNICHDTSVTDGVIGYCDESEVEDLLEQISRL